MIIERWANRNIVATNNFSNKRYMDITHTWHMCQQVQYCCDYMIFIFNINEWIPSRNNHGRFFYTMYTWKFCARIYKPEEILCITVHISIWIDYLFVIWLIFVNYVKLVVVYNHCWLLVGLFKLYSLTIQIAQIRYGVSTKRSKRRRAHRSSSQQVCTL